jgi:hypothetical protein
MYLGDWERADAQLQRHLKKYPQDAGAWLDLAIARHRQGDKEGAQELFILVETRFVPPVKIRQIIEQLRAENQAQPPARQFVTYLQSLALMYVHDSNANMGLTKSHLDITFGPDTIQFQIAPEYLPHSDWARQIQYLAAGNINVWNNVPFSLLQQLPPLEWLLLARQKNYHDESYFNNRQIQLNLAQPLQQGDRGFILRARLQEDKLDRRNKVNSLRLGLAYQRPLSGCRISLETDQEMRRQTHSDLLDSNIFWWGGEASCILPAYPDTRLQTWLRRGRDRDHSGKRANGDTKHTEIGLSLKQRFTPRWQVELGWQASFLEDSRGYSDILANGAKRHIRRRINSLSTEYKLDASLTALLQITDYHQYSNIPLFAAKNRSITLGLIYNW